MLSLAIVVFAAASLSDALTEIGATYPGGKVIFNFAASNTLARQIEEGAPADLFISADEEKMDWLQEKNLIAADTRKSLLSNTLVIVTDGMAITKPRDLLRVRRIALAEPSTVPAGIYAKKFLQNVHLWERLEQKVIPTENVRAALAAVEAGNADAAIVYKTDVSKKVRVAYEITEPEAPKISYAFAVTAAAENPAAARKFLEFLSSKEAMAVFKRHGFGVRRLAAAFESGGKPPQSKALRD
jgi:molybdate transport system substrate-binding protein